MWNYGKCCALGLPKIIEEESEILTASELPTTVNEEEGIDLDLIYDELESMKQSLLALRSKLVVTPPEKFQMQFIEEKHDESLTPAECQLFILRRQNCILRYHLHDLAQHLYTTRKEIKELQGRRIQLTEKFQKYYKELNDFELFKLNAIHQFGICIERWEQHKNTKINFESLMEIVRKLRAKLLGMHHSHVPLHCHEQLRNDVMLELIVVRLLLYHLFENLLDNVNYFARRMSARIPYESITSFEDRGSVFLKSPPNSFISYYSLLRD